MKDLKRPSYARNMRIKPANTVCEYIISETWGNDVVRAITWYDGEKNVHTGTQRAAIVAQASGTPAAEPCTHCVNNGGAFDECRVNPAWPLNGACASCSYWGHGTKHCNLADPSKTPRKSDKSIDKVINKLQQE
ncbi:hypothetical protein KEM55_006097, partial [Ascosphaera atra]